METTLTQIEDLFGGTNRSAARSDLALVTVPREQAVSAVTWLRDHAGYRHLVLLSVVDRIERGLFQLTYILHSYDSNTDIGVRVEIDRREPVMESIHHLWAGAQVYQRELKEMFGIDFPGSPRVDEPLILEGWNGIPPMRRDFDTKKYSLETYFPRGGRSTADPSERMANERYPREELIKRAIKKLVRGNREKK
jgi:NADH-quinone oxidoreductase subunit C